MEDKNKKIEFDPGFAPLVIESLGQVGYMYYMFNSVPDKKLKRLNFRVIASKLEKHLELNIAFYMGCLLWASYISEFENYEIEGNKLLGDNSSEKEYTGELDFLIDFIENQFPRDTKYYINRLYEPDKRYIPILKAYREFLVINKGFYNCSNTSDVKIPSCLKRLENKQLENIKNAIFSAIQEKNLVKLLDYFELIF